MNVNSRTGEVTYGKTYAGREWLSVTHHASGQLNLHDGLQPYVRLEPGPPAGKFTGIERLSLGAPPLQVADWNYAG